MKLFRKIIFKWLFTKLHNVILWQANRFSLDLSNQPPYNPIMSLDPDQSVAAVHQLGDILAATRKALADSIAASSETLRIVAPLANENIALKSHVAALEKSVAAFAKADADLDAALESELARVVEAPASVVPLVPATELGNAVTEVPESSDSPANVPDVTSVPTPEPGPEVQ